VKILRDSNGNPIINPSSTAHGFYTETITTLIQANL
jgi:hypothetical protein